MISHRGPDSSGFVARDGIAFLHARLSLVDLSDRSRQPFWDERGRYCLVYNGEIYNFREIRKDLADRRYRFHTTSDTEVLLASLIVNGTVSTLKTIRGMFAFAFWDTEERTVVLARDRLGIKPLILCEQQERLLFASEMKAFIPWLEFKPNRARILGYLLNGQFPTINGTLVKGVRFLTPGHYLKIDATGLIEAEECYYNTSEDLSTEWRDRFAASSPRQIVDLFDEALNASVRRMLFADAEVGALCSGGVDSSLILAIAAKYHSNLAIFHANVVGASELDAARKLADHLRIDLRHVDARDDHFLELLPRVTWHIEEPFNYHANSVPFLMVSNLVRENGVKAILTGEGSDECFLGYPNVVEDAIREQFRKMTSPIGGLLRRVPAIGQWFATATDPDVNPVLGLLNDGEGDAEYQQIRTSLRDNPAKLNGGYARTLGLLGPHLRTLLQRNDTLGMSASIEARFPFLDEELVAAAINLPEKYKVRVSLGKRERPHPFVSDKWVVRAVADRYLPAELSRRKKIGFPVTAFQRMNVDPRFFRDSYLCELLDLDRNRIGRFIQDNSQLITKLVLFEVWASLFLRGQSLENTSDYLHAYISMRPKMTGAPVN